MRTVVRNGEPWFVAADVCKALEVTNATQAVGRLDEDERAMFNIGRQGETNCVNEPGLYSLVLGSRKAQAKAFTGIPATPSHTGFHPVNDLRLNFLFSVCIPFVVPVAVYRCTYCTQEFEYQ